MNKVKVLLLSGCSYCDALTTKLDVLRIKYEAIDADVNTTLADDIERLIQSTTYPILLLEKPPINTILFRTTEAEKLGLHVIDHHTNKLGCVTIDNMLYYLQTLLKN